MALALNNLQRVDMPLNKETKPNLKSAIEENWSIGCVYSIPFSFGKEYKEGNMLTLES